MVAVSPACFSPHVSSYLTQEDVLISSDFIQTYREVEISEGRSARFLLGGAKLEKREREHIVSHLVVTWSIFISVHF